MNQPIRLPPAAIAERLLSQMPRDQAITCLATAATGAVQELETHPLETLRVLRELGCVVIDCETPSSHGRTLHYALTDLGSAVLNVLRYPQ